MVIQCSTPQTDKAFNLGNIVSEEQSIKGIDKFPNPPINKGIIIKKIINIPWKVIQELYCREGKRINPGKAIPNLIIRGNPIPTDPPIKPEIIYRAPIKTWFVVIKRIKEKENLP